MRYLLIIIITVFLFYKKANSKELTTAYKSKIYNIKFCYNSQVLHEKLNL
jgi:hypothetical protein